MDIKTLMEFCSGHYKLAVFDSRYSDGLVGILVEEFTQATAIEERFSGGDFDWADCRFPLAKLGWFPIVFSDSPEKIVTLMQEKLLSIGLTKTNYFSWQDAVGKVLGVYTTDGKTLSTVASYDTDTTNGPFDWSAEVVDKLVE